MLSREQIAEFRKNGYLVGPKVLGDGEADALCERMFAVLEGKGQRPSELTRNLLEGTSERKVFQVVNIWEADDLFREHLANEAICGMIAQLMDADVVRVWHDQIQYKPPQKGGKTGWHQDSMAWPPLGPKGQQVTAWIALDDADQEDGAMSMVL